MRGDHLTIVAVYVDDLMVATKTFEEMNEVKRSLAEQFKMNDLGEIATVLASTLNRIMTNSASGCIKSSTYLL